MYPSNRLVWKWDGAVRRGREPTKKTEEMREREREREAANNVWMEAAEVQQVSREMEGQIEKSSAPCCGNRIDRDEGAPAHAVGKMLHKPLK